MFDDFIKKAEDLCRLGESFAVATVVRSEPPVSGKPGDRAIVRSDRSIWGWIGGGCAQPTVIREALCAIEDGNPRLIRISPHSDQPEHGITAYTMECHSGGALDIYIEPVLPRSQILIFGRSPVAQTLARLALDIKYAVMVIAPRPLAEDFPSEALVVNEMQRNAIKITAATYVVVSTQGEDDEEAIEQALALRAPYVAFVASKVKGRKVLEYLAEKGLAPELLQRVKFPAGLDISASSPEEIAVSILAEIIQAKGNKAPQRASAVGEGDSKNRRPGLSVLGTMDAGPDTEASSLRGGNRDFGGSSADALDPVCGMIVDMASARHKSQYLSITYYFCCARCKETFDRSPDKFMAVAT
jgi:xanthine dehydrogenase accessory factor